MINNFTQGYSSTQRRAIATQDTSCSVCGETEHLKAIVMKIDLHNNFDTLRKQLKQSYEIRQWARAIGVNPREFENKIETHPKLEDVRVLIDIKNYAVYFNAKDTQVVNKIWYQVYEHEYPLSEYHRRKLLQVLDSVEYTQSKMKKAVKMMTKKGGPLAETKLTDFSV